MTTIRIRAGDRIGLEGLSTDALVLPMVQRRAQPRGVAGYADWILCGRIARLLLRGAFTGAAGERVLMPTGHRFGAERIFLFGIGPERPGGTAALAVFSDHLRVVAEAGARHLAVGFPEAPHTAPVDTTGAVEMALAWMQALSQNRTLADDVVLLDADGELAQASASLRRRADELRLEWKGA